jgi:hypothetical protein
MKTLIILLLFGLPFLASQAQTLQVSEESDNGREMHLQILGKYGDRVLLFGQYRGDFFVAARSDTSLKQIWKKEVKLPDNADFPLLFIRDTAGFTAVFSRYQQGQTWLSLVHIDSSGQIRVEGDIFSLSDRYTIDKDNLQISENKRYLAFALPTLSRKLHLALYDLAELRLLWQNHEKISDTEPLREHFASLVNNKGELFLFFNQKTSRRQIKEHHIRAVAIDSSKKISEYVLPIPDIYLQSCLAAYDERNQQVIVSGFSATTANLADAMFYIRLNPATYNSNNNPNEGISYKNSLYDQSFLRSVTASRRKKAAGIPNLQAEAIILRQDGGAMLIGEQVTIKNYELTVGGFPSSPKNVRQQADYWIGNVVLGAFHPDGNVHWQNVMHKNQNSENDFGTYSSFLLLKTPTALRLLYNQEIFNGTPIYEYSIDALGNSQRKLLEQRVTKQTIKFRRGVQTGANEAFVLAEQFNRLYLVKISYP